MSSMWPGPDDPDYGVFVAQVSDGLQAHGPRGHARRHRPPRRGKGKQGRLAIDALRTAVTGDPDVVYAHYLLPAGGIAALAALAGRAPLVLTAHGSDVRNVAESAGDPDGDRASPCVARRRSSPSRAGCATSCTASCPSRGRRPRSSTAASTSCASRPATRRRRGPALGLTDLPGSLVVHVGGQDERKNVLRLRDAVLGIPDATLLAVGDGPLH